MPTLNTELPEMPEAWRKPAPPVVPDPVDIPECDWSDPAQLYAWFGPFGLADNYRKVVLSSCEEIVRAQQTTKVSEQRLAVLAHVHPLYLRFLERSLYGRIEFEREVAKRGMGS